jgi:hypothetical protein
MIRAVPERDLSHDLVFTGFNAFEVGNYVRFSKPAGLRLRHFTCGLRTRCGVDQNMDDEIQEEITSGGESRAFPASPLQVHEYPALSGTHHLIRRLNRDTAWVATGLLGTVFFAALVLALQEFHQKADGFTEEPTQTSTSGELLPNANPAVNSDVVGSNGGSTSQITSGPASRINQGFTPETINPGDHANTTSWSPATRPDSARVIHTKIADVKLRSSVRPRYVDVKTRLIALWHQSLREKFRRWRLFSNSSNEPKTEVSYTAATSH